MAIPSPDDHADDATALYEDLKKLFHDLGIDQSPEGRRILKQALNVASQATAIAIGAASSSPPPTSQ